MRISISLLFSIFVISICNSQPRTDDFLKEIFSHNRDTVFKKVLGDPKTYRLQIVYTQIERDKKNRPHFRNYYFNFDPDLYFNPASTVKLPLALLSLEKLNQIKKEGVNKYTTIQFDSSYEKQTSEYVDSTSENGLPSIAHFVKKALLVSDNDAYNRFYEFIGQGPINRSLKDKGYTGIRITRQFKGFTADQNRHTNQVRFLDKEGNLVYLQPPAYNTDSFYFPQQIKLGKAHYNRDDSLIQAPFDFTMHNNLSLEDLQQILQSVLFPASVPTRQRFDLTRDDYDFFYRFLSQFPSETNYPNYDTSKFYDSYVKFYFRNNTHHLPEGVRVFNKVGWAYGFLIDASYVADFKNGVEFMLACTLYVNSDEILNDDHYDYETIGWPFMYQLGQTIYQYELNRQRKHKPDLSRFKMDYNPRPASNRPIISEVDN